jgi:hypothetical protein
MKACLAQPCNLSPITSIDDKAGSSKHAPNPLKPLFSEVGNLQMTSDKLMFSLVAAKFPSSYPEDQ